MRQHLAACSNAFTQTFQRIPGTLKYKPERKAKCSLPDKQKLNFNAFFFYFYYSIPASSASSYANKAQK